MLVYFVLDLCMRVQHGLVLDNRDAARANLKVLATRCMVVMEEVKLLLAVMTELLVPPQSIHSISMVQKLWMLVPKH